MLTFGTPSTTCSSTPLTQVVILECFSVPKISENLRILSRRLGIQVTRDLTIPFQLTHQPKPNRVLLTLSAFAVSLAAPGDGGIMAEVVMIQESTRGRLLTALRLAFYPAFEPAAEKRFEALKMEAENARGSGDLAKAEKLYLTAMAEARASSDPSHLNQTRHGLARVYREQRRYREAEHIFRDLLEEAVNSPQPNAQVHAGHMSFALIYQDEGKPAEAEEHYKAAVVETEKTELWPDRGFFCSTSMWLAKFYVEQHRYSESEPIFQRVLEIYEKDGSLRSSLPHHLEEFAKVYEAQEKYIAAEELYRRALKICEELDGGSPSWLTMRALDNLAGFCQARGRYPEAEKLFSGRLMIKIRGCSSEKRLATMDKSERA